MKKEEIIARYEYMIDYLATRLEVWVTPIQTKEELIKDARAYAIVQEILQQNDKNKK